MQDQNIRLACKNCGRLALQETTIENDGLCMICVKENERKELRPLSKIDGINTLYNIPLCYLSSKNEDYRERVLIVGQAIAEFFTEFSLSTINLKDRFIQKPDYFHLSLLDLNEEGRLFAKTDFQKWLINIDRWKGTDKYQLSDYKVSIKKAYLKFRSKNSKS
jgi:hypothetical protein